MLQLDYQASLENSEVKEKSFHVREPCETIRREDLSLYVWGDVFMGNTKRVRDRWFTAVAMTCLSGFALCGCTRGSRDLSSNLTESAGRDAIDAERHVAERKRQESGAGQVHAESPSRQQPASPSEAESEPWADQGDAIAVRDSSKPTRGQAQLDDADLETADWAGDYLDRRVQTVSEEDVGQIEAAEPLLESEPSQPVAADLFEEEDEATVRVQKPTRQDDPAEAVAHANKPPSRPGKASFDGTHEHPWAEKAPTVARSNAVNRPAAKPTLPRREPVDLSVNQAHRVAKSAPPASPIAEPQQQAEDQQADAKARIQTLLAQSRSLLNKGELRSAYRVAQLAQRIADSEELYFLPGEEQPADMVRSVLMRIRSEESQLASAGESSADESVSQFAPVTKPTSGSKAIQIRPQSNRPEGWSTGEWQNEQDHSIAQREQAVSDDNPWDESVAKTSSKSQMRIEPGPSSRGSRQSPEFPHSRQEWRSSSNEPLTLSSSTEVDSPKLPTDREGHRETNVVQADLNASPLTVRKPVSTAESASHVLVPRPFPAKSRNLVVPQLPGEQAQTTSDPLAMAEDWRNQDLNEAASNRLPLLMAPLPPEEPMIPDTLGTAVAVDDTFATDIQEPLPPQSDSKLWMILAAAAGAFALLFVRRRPAPVVRTSGVGQ